MTVETPTVEEARALRRQAEDDACTLLETEYPHLYSRCLDEAATVTGEDPRTLPDPHQCDWVRLRAVVLAQPRLLANPARCRGCGETVTSTHTHDLVSCRCGNLYVDGGLEYTRRGTTVDGPGFDELSIYETPTQVRARLDALPTQS